jgi:hypothetical protein
MRMGIRNSLTMLLPLFLFTALVSCGSKGAGSGSGSNPIPQTPIEEIHASTDTGSQYPLVGIWASGPYRLIFKSDNTYSRICNHDDTPAVSGNVQLSGNVIIVNDDSGGRYSCVNSDIGQVVSGTYTYNISGNTLTFNLFHDPCSDRAAMFSSVYTRQ